MNATVLVPMLGLAGLMAAFAIRELVRRRFPAGGGRELESSDEDRGGPLARLARVYAGLAIFSPVLALLLFTGLRDWRVVLAFAVGVLCSASAGCIGLDAESRVNPRAAGTDPDGAMRASFRAGSVYGLGTTSLGLLGVGSLYLLFGTDPAHAAGLHGFVLGALVVALFLSAGVGSGPVSGTSGPDGARADRHAVPVTAMGAVLLASWCGAIIAAGTIANTLPAPVTALIGPQQQLRFLPLALAAAGLVCALAGTVVVALLSGRPARTAISLASFTTSALFAGGAYFVVTTMDASPLVWLCILGGIVGGHVTFLVSGHYSGGAPVRRIARAVATGPATVLIQGLATGMGSVLVPVLAAAALIGAAGWLMPEGAGFFGVGMVGVGMLSTMGTVLALHACDSAARAGAYPLDGEPGARKAGVGSGAMAGHGWHAAGNLATLAAALAALTIIGACIRILSLQLPDFALRAGEPSVIIGLFLGGMLPFLLVGIILHVPRRDGWAGFGGAVLWRSLLTVTVAALAPVVAGFGFGARAMGGMLAGVLVSGFLLALFGINAGGAWDGAGRYLEQDDSADDGGGIGDTVGRYLGTVSGTSVNVLINVTAVVSLMIAPLLSR